MAGANLADEEWEGWCGREKRWTYGQRNKKKRGADRGTRVMPRTKPKGEQGREAGEHELKRALRDKGQTKKD